MNRAQRRVSDAQECLAYIERLYLARVERHINEQSQETPTVPPLAKLIARFNIAHSANVSSDEIDALLVQKETK